MKLAVFDVDGTLVRSGSERAFWRYLAANGHQGPRQVVAYAIAMLRHLPATGIHVTKKNKAYLSGLGCTAVETLAAAFVAEWTPSQWYAPAVQRLQQCRRRGDIIVLLSGTPDFILRPLAGELGVQYFCGSLPAQRGNQYSAGLPFLHPFGETKAAIVSKLTAQFGVGWQDISAYGDSAHDLPLLERVGGPVAVRPDGKLRRRALARGWEIIDTPASRGLHAPGA